MSVVCSAAVAAPLGPARPLSGNGTVGCETLSQGTTPAESLHARDRQPHYPKLIRLLGWSLLLLVTVAAVGCANRPRPSATTMFGGWNTDRFAQREPSTAPSESASVVANRPVLPEGEETSSTDDPLTAEGSSPRNRLVRGALENPWSSSKEEESHEDGDRSTADIAAGKRRRWGTDWLPGRRQREESAVAEAVREGIDPFEQVRLNDDGADTTTDNNPVNSPPIDLANSTTTAVRPESSQVERLREALVQDTRRATADESTLQSETNQRAQVDALMEQAGRLLEQGEMSRALEQVRVAVRMSEQAELEYSPDEQRPIDLQRLIEDTLEELETESPAEPEDQRLGGASREQGLITTTASERTVGRSGKGGLAGQVIPSMANSANPVTWQLQDDQLPGDQLPGVELNGDTGRVQLNVGSVTERVTANTAQALPELPAARSITVAELAGPAIDSPPTGITSEPADQHRAGRTPLDAPIRVAMNTTDGSLTDSELLAARIESPGTVPLSTSETESTLDVAREDASQSIAGPSTFRSLETSSLLQRRAALEQHRGESQPATNRASTPPEKRTSGTSLPWNWLATLLLVSCLPWTLRWFGKASPKLVRQPTALG